MSKKKKDWLLPLVIKDWLEDDLLQSVSLAARGAWLQIIMFMQHAQTGGRLVVDRKKPTDEQLETIIGAKTPEILCLLKELTSSGVADISKSGIVSCRRMVREHEISRIRSSVGRKGAYARWGKSDLPQADDGKGDGKENGLPSSDLTFAYNTPNTNSIRVRGLLRSNPLTPRLKSRLLDWAWPNQKVSSTGHAQAWKAAEQLVKDDVSESELAALLAAYWPRMEKTPWGVAKNVDALRRRSTAPDGKSEEHAKLAEDMRK